MPRRRTSLLLGVVSAIALSLSGPVALAIESIHYGYSESYPAMTDAIRLSTRIGYAWWSANQKRYNVEAPFAGIPYSYHDGAVNSIGTTRTPAEAAARWRSILTGGGDPWIANGGGAPGIIGTPTIILLDEINTNFKDNQQGPAFRSALQQFIALGGTKSQIVILCSPALSMGSGVVASNYGDVIYCANNYCRWFVLEVYVTQNGFMTGYDPGDPTPRGTGDTYLANRLTFGLRNWTTTMGVNAQKVMPMIQICNIADQSQTNFYKFMNRCFWFMANGWYNAAHSGVDANVKTALRNGVGSYTWAPGTGSYQLITSATTRDTYFEKYLVWYCDGLNLAAHSDGVTPPP